MASSEKYTRTAIALHWLMALLIAINIFIGLTMGWYPQDWVRPIIDFHKSTGIVVIGLFIARLAWRLTHKPPPLPARYKNWEKNLARLVYQGLYALIFLVPLSGWIHDSAWSGALTHPMKLYHVIPWFRIGFISNLDPEIRESVHRIFGIVHTYLSYALCAALALHIAGALKHQWLEKEKELQRMWWPRRGA